MHVLDRRFDVTPALRAPRASLDIAWNCHPFVTFGALPQQRCLVVDIGVGETSAASAIGELLHRLDHELLGHSE